MIIGKKTFLALLISFAVLLIAGCNKSNQETLYIPLMEFGDCVKIDIDKVDSLEIDSFNEDGEEKKEFTDRDEILKKYNYLNSFVVGEETNLCYQDNTVIYTFKMKDKSVSIEKESDVLVVNNKRYKLIKE